MNDSSTKRHRGTRPSTPVSCHGDESPSGISTSQNQKDYLCKLTRDNVETDYQPIDRHYQEYLESLVALRKYVVIQYYTELKEFISTTAIIKAGVAREGADY